MKYCVNFQNGEEIFNIVREVVGGAKRKKLRKGHMEQNTGSNFLPIRSVQVFDFLISTMNITLRTRDCNIFAFSCYIYRPVFCSNS